MSVTVGDFIGSWRIGLSTGPAQKILNAGWILIGTNSEYGDSPPALTGKYTISVGFAILDQDGNPLLSTRNQEDDDANQPLLFLLEGNDLRWQGYYKRQPLYIYVSAAELATPGGGRYVSIYGNTIYGDPDQVGVWGGTGTPPPTGDSPPPTLSGS